MKPFALAALLALSLAACREETIASVPPATLNAEAVGRYCGMNLAEHEGPKGQVILAEGHDPFWFSSARDALAFTMMPDEPKDYAAIYVSDMGRAESWADPGADNWVEARQAVYVTGSDARGGMGLSEIVPFSSRDAAEAFAAEHGGAVAAFGDLTPEQVLGGGSRDGLGAGEAPPGHEEHGQADHEEHAHDHR